VKTSENTNEIYKSLIEVLPEIENLYPKGKVSVKTKKGYTYEYDYIPLEQIIDEVKPKMGKYGLAFIQSPSSLISENDKIGVTTRIIHLSGQWIEDSVYTKISPSGDSSYMQCLGASISYLRRYGLAAIFGIAADVNIDEILNKKEKENIRENYQQKIDEFNQLIKTIDQSIVDAVDKQNVKNLIELINKGKADSKRISNTTELLKKKYLNQ
jgi:hypothetical protein